MERNSEDSRRGMGRRPDVKDNDDIRFWVFLISASVLALMVGAWAVVNP